MARSKKVSTKDNMLGRILSYGLVFLVLVMIVLMIERKQTRRAADAKITIEPLSTGDFLIKGEDVISIVDKAFGHEIIGVPLGNLDMERMERVLEASTFVKSAETFIDAENIVHLKIVQREPIVRIIDRDGQSYYLDKTGEKMETSNHHTARVLVATGNIQPFDPEFKTSKRHHLRRVFELTEVILKDDLLEPLVAQIHVADNGDVQMIPNIGDQRIILGNLEELDNKLFRLKTFYKEALSRMGWNKYKTINLKFKNQVVCEKR